MFSCPALSAQFKKARTIGPEEFMFLCEGGSAEEISKALKNGASAGISYTDGTTTLMVAAKTNTPEAVKVLLDAGVNVNAKNSDGNTALLIAAQFNYNPEVIDILVEAGAEDTSNKNAETALMLAAKYNGPEIVLALVKAGADETAKSRTGETALSIAKARKDDKVINALFDFDELCEKGSPEEILKAIQAGAVVNPKFEEDTFGCTPLMFATASNTPQAVEILLRTGADVNAHDYSGETSLAIATQLGSPEKIEFLLNFGADTLAFQYIEEEIDENGMKTKTALDFANENEKLKGTEVLKHLKAKVQEQSNALNQCILGHAYYIGNGVRQNFYEAFKWYKRAADQNNSQAQYAVALMYRDGIGTIKDEGEYQRFWKLAADNGNTQALIAFGDPYLRDFERIIDFASIGYLNRQEFDAIKNFLPAFRYYSMAAEKGSADAQYRLAKLFTICGGFPVGAVTNILHDINSYGNSYRLENVEDSKMLNEFFSALSIKGTVGGGMNSEYFLENFRLNIRSLAVKWFREAARQGHKEAQNALRKMKETW